MALKYTPAESTGIFSRLLSQRSEAEQRLGEYTSGLEDAKKASMMTADMLEVSKLNLITHLAATVSATSIRSGGPDLAHLGAWQNKMQD